MSCFGRLQFLQQWLARRPAWRDPELILFPSLARLQGLRCAFAFAPTSVVPLAPTGGRPGSPQSAGILACMNHQSPTRATDSPGSTATARVHRRAPCSRRAAAAAAAAALPGPKVRARDLGAVQRRSLHAGCYGWQPQSASLEPLEPTEAAASRTHGPSIQRIQPPNCFPPLRPRRRRQGVRAAAPRLLLRLWR